MRARLRHQVPSPGSRSYLAAPLPQRDGVRPSTNSCLPHKQLTAVSSPLVQKAQLARVFGDGRDAFHGSSGPHRSVVSLPDTLAHHMCAGEPCPNAMVPESREWAHVHEEGGGTGSWHAVLSEADAAAALHAGWAERHLMAGREYKGKKLPEGLVMLYAPRDDAEIDIVLRIVQASYDFARDTRS
jgi:phospholipase/carboxylesterase